LGATKSLRKKKKGGGNLIDIIGNVEKRREKKNGA